jgi:hypothetical protein
MSGFIAVIRMSVTKATKVMLVMLVTMLTFSWAVGKNLGQPGEKDRLISELDVSSMTDDTAVSLKWTLTRLEHFLLQTSFRSVRVRISESQPLTFSYKHHETRGSHEWTGSYDLKNRLCLIISKPLRLAGKYVIGNTM